MLLTLPSLCCLQIFQASEKLGLYGKNTVGNTDYYIGAGDSGHITVGGTIGGMVIAGMYIISCQSQVAVSCSLLYSKAYLSNRARRLMPEMKGIHMAGQQQQQHAYLHDMLLLL